jgi:CDP-diacylglycerol--serine O-phosphatidyltransferase
MTNSDNQDSDADAADEALIGEHVEEVTENGKAVRHKGVYLLPNFFTTGALFSGFYAIISSLDGRFETAAIAIFVAMILDGLDGRVARLTNTQSAFGTQYDSLADMVSFGVAPALTMFIWALSSAGKLGLAASFIYTTCAALRLARFNTQVASADNRYFTGLASPAAAAVLAGIVWNGSDMKPDGVWIYALVGVTALSGIMMVTTFRYSSFKGLDFRGRVPFVMILLAILIFAAVSIDPPKILLAVAAFYALSGPVTSLFTRKLVRTN